MGNYNILLQQEYDIITIQNRIHDMTQLDTIEKYYDSRIMQIFGDNAINKITKLPVLY